MTTKGEPQPYPITVSFRRGIRADGEILYMSIYQENQEVKLTRRQAITLMQQLKGRLEEPTCPTR